MQRQQHYSAFSKAKSQIGLFREEAHNARIISCETAKKILFSQTRTIIKSLKEALPFLRSMGMACETQVMITFYTTLLRRIDSS